MKGEQVVTVMIDVDYLWDSGPEQCLDGGFDLERFASRTAFSSIRMIMTYWVSNISFILTQTSTGKPSHILLHRHVHLLAKSHESTTRVSSIPRSATNIH